MEYLAEVKRDLAKHEIETIFTPGKEIENIFLNRDLLYPLIPPGATGEFDAFLDEMFKSEYDDCLGSLVTLHVQCSQGANKDAKTILLQQKPKFDKSWNDYEERFSIVGGKNALAQIRNFLKQNYGIRLPTKFLVKELTQSQKKELIEKFVTERYQL